MLNRFNICAGTIAVLMLIYIAIEAANSDTGAGYLHLFCLFLAGVLACIVAQLIIARE